MTPRTKGEVQARKVGEHLDVLCAYNRGWHSANAAAPTDGTS